MVITNPERTARRPVYAIDCRRLQMNSEENKRARSHR